jgi:hypothetical protein
MITWILALYMAGMVLMWAFIGVMDDADAYRRHFKKLPLRKRHFLMEKTFLCFVWPIFSLIYIYMESMVSKSDL